MGFKLRSHCWEQESLIGLDVCFSLRDHPNEVQKERGMLSLQESQLGEFLYNFEECLKERGGHFAEALGLLKQECSG